MDLSKRPDHEAPMDLTNSNPLWMWEVVFSMTKGPPVTRELRILDIDHENCSILLSGIKRGVMDQNSASRRFKNELLIAECKRSTPSEDNENNEEESEDEDELGVVDANSGYQIRCLTTVPKFSVSCTFASENVGYYSLCCRKTPAKEIFCFVKNEDGTSSIKVYNVGENAWSSLPEMKFSKKQCRLIFRWGNCGHFH